MITEQISEKWRDIPEYEGRYAVSDIGNVMNVKKDKLLRPFDRAVTSNKNKKGYLTVHLTGNGFKYKNKSVHSLVLLAFERPRKKGEVINHIDGNPSNNRLENLEYCTQSHNRKQDFVTGRQSFLGEKNNSAKINSTQVLEIVKLRSKGHTYRAIAKIYGLNFTGIANIFNGHTWTHVTGFKNKY